MTCSKDLRVGVVGLGPHFRETLLPALIGQDGVILSAFCDMNGTAREWVRVRFPHAVVTDQVSGQEFWSAIDCVICCSWPGIHERVLVLSIDHYKHCFCEKPAASSAAALDEILNQEPRDLVIRVGHTFRYMGGARRFIELTNNAKLTCLEVTYLGSGPNGSRWGMDPRKSFSLTHLTHAVDFVTAAAGDIREVHEATWSSRGDTDSVAVSFGTEQCQLATLFATNAASAFTCKASAVFENGALVHLDSLRNVTFTGQTLKEKRSGAIWKERDLGTISQNDGYMDELCDFFAEIRGSGQCRLPDLVHARHVLQVIEQIEG